VRIVDGKGARKLNIKRQNSKLKTMRTISAWLSRIAGRAGVLCPVVEIPRRVLGWGVFSVHFAGSARQRLRPSGIGPDRAKERGLPGGQETKTFGPTPKCFRTGNARGPFELGRCGMSGLSRSFALPPDVSSLISRRLEQKRRFFASFLTLNHFDFS
jgi:hypothetical protein